MRIADFTADYALQAAQIAKQNYGEERLHVPALPPVDFVPDLTPLAKNGLGVAAFEGDAMLGFLCAAGPFANAFGSAGVDGLFSPMGANGAAGGDRARVYARMYQAAGEKWVRAGASSHAVCLYAHDKEALEQFFRYGFGLRCIDAIRPTDGAVPSQCEGYTFSELTTEDMSEIYRLKKRLDAGYLDSPFFMLRKTESEAEFLSAAARCRPVCFAARYRGQAVAFIRAELDGETFIKDTPGYIHCNSLYCLPEHRGGGVSQRLLYMLMQKLREQGYTRLGVDFESINPSGSGFWLKYFGAYTHSLIRRVDEGALK